MRAVELRPTKLTRSTSANPVRSEPSASLVRLVQQGTVLWPPMRLENFAINLGSVVSILKMTMKLLII